MSQYAAGTEASLPPVVIEHREPAAVRKARADVAKHFADQAAANAPPADLDVKPAVDGAPAGENQTPEVIAQPAVEQPAPVTPQSNEPPLSAEDLEHRYRSARGREAAALRRAEAAEAQAQSLAERLTLLENQVRNPVPAAPGPLPDLTPDEIEALGPDLVNMVNKRAAIIARQETARLAAELEAFKAGQNATAEQRQAAAKEMFFADLDAAMPDWRVINTDDKFISWCNEPDLLSGQTRRDLLIGAFNKNDTQRVVAFFKLFTNSGGVPGSRAGTPQAQGADQPPRLPLEALAAPGRGGSGTAPVAPPKNVWSAQDITRFYDDVRRGRFVGREAEQRAYEADLMLAQAEGRVSS